RVRCRNEWRECSSGKNHRDTESTENYLCVSVVGYLTFSCNPKYSGSFPTFHLMLQPTLGFCSVEGVRPSSTASAAARRSDPVMGVLFRGRLSSNCPR